MVGPMSTLIMGVVILGEPMNAWIVVGTALVLGGVFLVSRKAP
jgi:drug/metabolite transporter (DMT)-like permease